MSAIVFEALALLLIYKRAFSELKYGSMATNTYLNSPKLDDSKGSVQEITAQITMFENAGSMISQNDIMSQRRMSKGIH